MVDFLGSRGWLFFFCSWALQKYGSPDTAAIMAWRTTWLRPPETARPRQANKQFKRCLPGATGGALNDTTAQPRIEQPV